MSRKCRYVCIVHVRPFFALKILACISDKRKGGGFVCSAELWDMYVRCGHWDLKKKKKKNISYLPLAVGEKENEENPEWQRIEVGREGK